MLKTGQDITIDARNGIIYDGIVADLVKKGTPAAQAAGTAAVAAEYFPPTGTRVLMNLGDPDLADKYASLPVTVSDSCGKNLSGPPLFMNIRCT